MTIDGYVGANVSAEAVSVRAGGCLDGDVAARSVAIDDGGRVQGSIEMDFDLPPGLIGGGA